MAPSKENLVEVENLCVAFPAQFGAVRSVNGVSFTVKPGEIVGIVGESGSGKSVSAMTLLNLLPNTARVSSDRMQVAGVDLKSMSEKQWQKFRGNSVSMIFQEPMAAMNRTRRVGRQLLDVLARHRKMPEKQAQDHIRDLLRSMHLPNPERILRAYPFELSGGQLQRVLIAMAFSCEPQLIIADEPTTALDVTVQAQILALLRERARMTETAVILITHDLAVVRQLCDRVYVLYAGQVVEEGACMDVLNEPTHPYTKALLSSLPQTARHKAHITTIPGSPPAPNNLPPGCPFQDRCSKATVVCEKMPDWSSVVRQSHRVRCWHSSALAGEIQ